MKTLFLFLALMLFAATPALAQGRHEGWHKHHDADDNPSYSSTTPNNTYPYNTYPYNYNPYNSYPYGYSPYGYSPYGYSPYGYYPDGTPIPAPTRHDDDDDD